MKQHNSPPSFLSADTKRLFLRSSPLLLLPLFLPFTLRPLIHFILLATLAALAAALAYILYYTHSPLQTAQTSQHHLFASKVSVPKQMQAPLDKVFLRKGSGLVDLSKLPNVGFTEGEAMVAWSEGKGGRCGERYGLLRSQYRRACGYCPDPSRR